MGQIAPRTSIGVLRADRELVKAAPFEYRRPSTLNQAVEMLGESGEDARVLAGGQSLIPLMNLRLVRPSLVVDINGLTDLAGIMPTSEGLLVGALTRHRAVETEVLAPPFDLLSAAASRVGSLPIRTRGTFGGSLAHADPTAELPLAALILDARIALRGPQGERTVAAENFLVGAFRTAAADDEIVTGALLPPAPARARWSFDETGPPLKVVAAVVVDTASDGSCTWARIGLTGIGDAPHRCWQAEDQLVGRMLDDAAAEAATGAAVADLRARTGHARVAQLGGVLVRRAVERLRSAPEGQ